MLYQEIRLEIKKELTKSELLEKLAEQHKDEIKCNNESCEQVITWQDGEIVYYKKIEKYK